VTLLPSITATDVAEVNPQAALLPVGSFEQHGGHLPLATDAIVASTIAHRLANEYQLLELPPVTIACSHEHETVPYRPGTVSISATTLACIVQDVYNSLTRMGIYKLFVINAHGGNYLLQNVTQEANVAGRRRMGLYPGRADWVAARESAGMVTDIHSDMHAGELETSILMSEHPELVRDSYKDADFEATDRPHLSILGMAGYTATGVIGKPSTATPEKGSLALESLTESFAPYLALFQDDASAS
jgi:creatinine amidohydrolase